MKGKYFILLLAVLLSCGKKDPVEPDGEEPAPKVATLISPLQNEVCTIGTVLSATESTITFIWNAAEHAESYELIYKNLETGAVGNAISNDTKVAVKLIRNTPYSWKIVAKTSKTAAVSTSETWKFYNAGNGVTAYAPYPAELTSPMLGYTITPVAGKISLAWKGSDADGDIASYTVYFGTTVNPPLFSADIVASTLADVPVSNATTYYWKVVTKDSKGNTSTSDLGEFKTN